MSKNYQIRFVKKSDLDNVIQLCKLHADFEKAFYSIENKVSLLENALFFTNKSGLYCLVVEKENKLIGYATYIKQFSTWDVDYYLYLDCLFLTEDSRGFGIGEHLMNRIKVEANKLNCSSIQWQTPEFNTRAIKFYDRIGGVSKTKQRYFLKT